MKNGKQKPTSGAKKISGWFFAFLGMALICLVLLGMHLLRDNRMVNAPASDLVAAAPVWETELPTQSVQKIDSVQSVQSIQPVQFIQSLQSVQATNGLLIGDIGMLQLADLKARDDLPAEWQNILLLGSDSRDMNTVTLLDTIIIASINKTTGELKLTSILRDTVVPIPGRGMQRINTAAYFGGPSLLMQTINANFGMNITEYVLVNFAGMAKAIDALGGINLDIDQKEMEQINRHMGEIAAYTMDKADYLAKRDGMKLKAPGANVLLNGIQAVSYARIRNIDSDVTRTGRQRLVILRILERAKNAGVGELLSNATRMWGSFQTNIDMLSGVAMTKAIFEADNAKIVPEFTIPYAKTRQSKDGALVDVDLTANTLQLHNFIYGSPIP